jgi:hypothetical protein
VLPNCDDGLTKDELVAAGWPDWESEPEQLFDTDDPLLDGPVPLPPGAWANAPDQTSASEPPQFVAA